MNADVLAASLIKEIKAANLPHGARLPGIKDIADKYQVSPITAQKAVQQLKAQNQLTSIRGKGIFLNKQTTKQPRIGIVSMYYGGDALVSAVAYQSYLEQATEYLKASDCVITRYQKDDLEYDIDKAKELLASIDGLLVTIGCLDQLTIPLFSQWGRPVVVIQHEWIMPQQFHQVIPDLHGGFCQLANFWLEQGVTSLLVASTSKDHLEQRITALLSALQSTGAAELIKVEQLKIDQLELDTGRLTGLLLGEKILQRGLRPDEVIFTPSDFLAFGIIDAMKRENRLYGQDYRLTSYDNLEANMQYHPEGQAVLTCVDNPKAQIGLAAAELLLQSSNFSVAGTHLIRIPCQLVIRHSMTKGSQLSN